ncbi:hypothetical protein Tco_0482438, partial [Tanacetum coccineum]
QRQRSKEGKVETELARVSSKLRLALAAHATDSTNFLQKEYGQWIVGSRRSLLWVMVAVLKDYMVFNPFINGDADLHDRHRDMRLDVDNLSCEELLALEERIGDVKTGLTDDVILKSMKQRKHMIFMDISIFWSHAAYVG